MRWSAAVVGGPTLLDDTNRDVNIAGLSQQGYDPWTLTLEIPAKREDLVAEFVSGPKRVHRTALLELGWDGTTWLRMRPTRARFDKKAQRWSVEFQDRRYNLKRRKAGRVGDNPSLNDPIPTDETALGSWTLVTTGSPTIDISPQLPTDATVFGHAVRMSSDGRGPDYIAFTADVPADPVAVRQAFFLVLQYFPAPYFALNEADLAAEIVATDVGLGEVVDVGPRAMANADMVVPGVWQIPYPIAVLQPGIHYSLEARIYFQQGLILVEAPNLTIQEVLSWQSAPTGQRIRDLITHANDTTTMGHSDTGISADSTSVPDGDLKADRVIYFKEQQLVGDAIDENVKITQQWPWLELQTSRELYHLSDPAPVSFVFDETNSEEGDAEAQGDAQTDVLSIYAPDNNPFTGERLVTDISVDGVLQAGEHDYGDERVEVGPWGNYDPRFVYQTLEPVWKAREQAGTETLDVFGVDILAAIAAQDVRTGQLIDGLDIRGDGAENFSITGIDINARSVSARLTLNREAPGS